MSRSALTALQEGFSRRSNAPKSPVIIANHCQSPKDHTRAHLVMKPHGPLYALAGAQLQGRCRGARVRTSQFCDCNGSCAPRLYIPAMWAIGVRKPTHESAICTCRSLRSSFVREGSRGGVPLNFDQLVFVPTMDSSDDG